MLIVGTGAFAQGLASLAIRSGATASYDIALGSRRGSGVLPGLEETPVRTLGEALPQADLVRSQHIQQLGRCAASWPPGSHSSTNK